MITKEIEIINKLGLHARAAAKFVALASTFDSHIEISKNGRKVNGKSIMGVMMLAASKGTVITLYIEGSDQEKAASDIEVLINNRFDEDE